MIYSYTVMPKQKNKTRTVKTSVKEANRSKKTTKKQAPSKDKFRQSIYERLKLDESYASLILGALAVVFLVIFLLLALGSKKAVNKMEAKISPKPTAAKSPTPAVQKTYILQEDEGLWDVAVRFYGDGTLWSKIAEANHLDFPDYVEPGTKLIIP